MSPVLSTQLQDVLASSDFDGDPENAKDPYAVRVKDYANCLRIEFSRTNEPTRVLLIEQKGDKLNVIAAHDAETDADCCLVIDDQAAEAHSIFYRDAFRFDKDGATPIEHYVVEQIGD